MDINLLAVSILGTGFVAFWGGWIMHLIVKKPQPVYTRFEIDLKFQNVNLQLETVNEKLDVLLNLSREGKAHGR